MPVCVLVHTFMPYKFTHHVPENPLQYSIITVEHL